MPQFLFFPMTQFVADDKVRRHSEGTLHVRRNHGQPASGFLIEDLVAVKQQCATLLRVQIRQSFDGRVNQISLFLIGRCRESLDSPLGVQQDPEELDRQIGRF